MARWILAALIVPILGIALSVLSSALEARSDQRLAPITRTYGREAISDQYRWVPLVALLAAPERYEGRKVTVEGFLALEFEDTSLNPDKESWAAGLHVNSMMVEPPVWAPAAIRRAVTRRYAQVSGTFTSKDGPGYGYGGGAIQNVERIQLMYARADFHRMMLRNAEANLRQHLLSGWFLSVVGWTALASIWIMRRKA